MQFHLKKRYSKSRISKDYFRKINVLNTSSLTENIFQKVVKGFF